MRRIAFFVGVPLALVLLVVVLIYRLSGVFSSPGPVPGDSLSRPHEGSRSRRPSAAEALRQQPAGPEAGAAPQAQTASATRSPAGAPGVARIELAFKLDPRVTRSLHMGDRWVSPPSYTSTGPLDRVSVDARARVVGGSAGTARSMPVWSASEPDMVEVSPEEAEQVRITVWRTGQSSLTVETGGITRTLRIRAAEVSGALRVDISQ